MGQNASSSRKKSSMPQSEAAPAPPAPTGPATPTGQQNLAPGQNNTQSAVLNRKFKQMSVKGDRSVRVQHGAPVQRSKSVRVGGRQSIQLIPEKPTEPNLTRIDLNYDDCFSTNKALPPPRLNADAIKLLNDSWSSLLTCGSSGLMGALILEKVFSINSEIRGEFNMMVLKGQQVPRHIVQFEEAITSIITGLGNLNEVKAQLKLLGQAHAAYKPQLNPAYWYVFGKSLIDCVSGEYRLQLEKLDKCQPNTELEEAWRSVAILIIGEMRKGYYEVLYAKKRQQRLNDNCNSDMALRKHSDIH